MAEYCSECGVEIDRDDGEASDVFPPGLLRAVLGKSREDQLCPRCQEEAGRRFTGFLDDL